MLTACVTTSGSISAALFLVLAAGSRFGLAGLAVFHRFEGLDDVELGSLAVGEEHVLVDMLSVHGHLSRGALEGQAIRRRHAFMPVGAASLLHERLGAVDAGKAIDADD